MTGLKCDVCGWEFARGDRVLSFQTPRYHGNQVAREQDRAVWHFLCAKCGQAIARLDRDQGSETP